MRTCCICPNRSLFLHLARRFWNHTLQREGRKKTNHTPHQENISNRPFIFFFFFFYFIFCFLLFCTFNSHVNYICQCCSGEKWHHISLLGRRTKKDKETMESEAVQTINSACTWMSRHRLGLTAWRVFKERQTHGSLEVKMLGLPPPWLCPSLPLPLKTTHHLVLPLGLPAQTDPHLGSQWFINHPQKGVLSLACQHSWLMEGGMTPSAHYMKERVSDWPDRLLFRFFLVPKKRNMSTSTRAAVAAFNAWVFSCVWMTLFWMSLDYFFCGMMCFCSDYFLTDPELGPVDGAIWRRWRENGRGEYGVGKMLWICRTVAILQK